MKHILILIALTTTLYAAETVSTVTGTPGLVAFWDFVKRESAGAAASRFSTAL